MPMTDVKFKFCPDTGALFRPVADHPAICAVCLCHESQHVANPFRAKCAWCGVIVREGIEPPTPNDTICPKCAKKVMEPMNWFERAELSINRHPWRWIVGSIVLAIAVVSLVQFFLPV